MEDIEESNIGSNKNGHKEVVHCGHVFPSTDVFIHMQEMYWQYLPLADEVVKYCVYF